MRRVIEPPEPYPGKLDLAEQVIVTDGGPWAEHNVACPVCGERTAILDLSLGVFQPCDRCRSCGWVTLPLRGWLARRVRDRARRVAARGVGERDADRERP